MKNASIYRKKSLLWLVIPYVATIFILLAYTFIIATDLSQKPDTMAIIDYVSNIILIVALAFVLIGTLLSIKYTGQANKAIGNDYDKRSGAGNKSKIPDEIGGWNWAAAFLGPLWGIHHRVWVSLVYIILMYLKATFQNPEYRSLISFVFIFWCIIMGFYGNKWAWQKTKWESVEQFKKSQAKWKPWGIAVLVIPLIIIGSGVLLAIILQRIA